MSTQICSEADANELLEANRLEFHYQQWEATTLRKGPSGGRSAVGPVLQPDKMALGSHSCRDLSFRFLQNVSSEGSGEQGFYTFIRWLIGESWCSRGTVKETEDRWNVAACPLSFHYKKLLTDTSISVEY